MTYLAQLKDGFSKSPAQNWMDYRQGFLNGAFGMIRTDRYSNNDYAAGWIEGAAWLYWQSGEHTTFQSAYSHAYEVMESWRFRP